MHHPILYIVLPILLAVAIFFIVKSLIASKRTTDVIALLGAVDAGKTALFFRYASKTFVPTQSSMVMNEETLPITDFTTLVTKKHRKEVVLVDFPGHERLRAALPSILVRSIGLVFLIDGESFNDTYSKAGRMLYEILSNKDVIDNRIPILIAVNKADKMLGDMTSYVKTKLQEEITSLIQSEAAAPGAKQVTKVTEFSFDKHASRISFCQISVITNELVPVSDFIAKIAVK
ncbi:hypothetical protein RCL1_001865 [Eukaryota sp. TZLM3-RCL]